MIRKVFHRMQYQLGQMPAVFRKAHAKNLVGLVMKRHWEDRGDLKRDGSGSNLESTLLIDPGPAERFLVAVVMA